MNEGMETNRNGGSGKSVLPTTKRPRRLPSLSFLLFRSPALPFLLASALFAACGSPLTEAPPVADSTFVSALAELHLAEARLRAAGEDDEQRLPRRDTMRVSVPPTTRDSILARHGTSYGPFRSTLEYYIRRPEEYTALYARVVDTLSAEQEAFRFETRQSMSPGQRPTPEAFQEDSASD